MRAEEWAARCMCEAQLHGDNNAFVTLTYAKNPYNLIKKDFVKFMHDLRREYGNGIKYFHCGEYGTLRNRPHHHVALFNIKIDDKEKLINSNLSISNKINKIWKKGITTIGEVTYASSLYIAKYLVKCAAGCDDFELGLANGESVSQEGYGEDAPRPPRKQEEYVSMSRRPGIGKAWVDRFGCDLERLDAFVASEHKIQKVPRYFDKIRFSKKTPEQIKEVKDARAKKAKKHELTREVLLKQMNAKINLERSKPKGKVDNG